MSKILAILAIIATTNLMAQPNGGIGQFISVYFEHCENNGINKNSDWKWIEAVSKALDIWDHFDTSEKRAQIEILKETGKHELSGLSHCTGPDPKNPTYRYDFLIEGTFGLNEKQTDIILTSLTRIKIDRRTIGKDDQQRPKFVDRTNVVDIKPSKPVTMQNITTDLLNPLREKRKQISDELGL
jgi:hypothetical protein